MHAAAFFFLNRARRLHDANFSGLSAMPAVSPTDGTTCNRDVLCFVGHTDIGFTARHRTDVAVGKHQEGHQEPWATFTEKMAVGMGQMETKVFTATFPEDFEVGMVPVQAAYDISE